jgi:PAS domain S-box-containing protein
MGSQDIAASPGSAQSHHPASQFLSSELSLARDLFGTLLETAAQAVIAVDDEGRIALINAAAERMFDYRREELLGQTLELLLPERLHELHRQHRSEYFS